MSRKTFTVQFNSDTNRKFIFKNCPEDLHVGCHSGFSSYKQTSAYTEIVHKDQTLNGVVSSGDSEVVFCFWFDDKTDVSIENCKSSINTAHYSRKEGYEGYHLADSDENYYNFGIGAGANDFIFDLTNATDTTTTKEITINTSITNCTYTTTPTTPEVGKEFSIKINANDGYVFKTIPTLTYADNDGYSQNIDLTKVSDTEYSGTFSAADKDGFEYNPPIENFTLTANAEKSDVKPPTPTEPTYVTFTKNTDNCSVVISPEKPTTKENFTVTISPEPNYTFTTKPKVTYVDSDGYEHELSYELNNETYTFTYTFIDNEISEFTINANATPKTDISSKYGVITVYNPTQEEMKKISKVVFRLPVSGEVVDVSNYVIKYFRVFCNVESVGKGTVSFGKYSTDIKSNVINNDIVELECGNVQIVGKHKNTLDYENTDIEIFLPFVGIEKLDAIKIMDKTIDLVYRCNILSGQCKALIFIDDIMIYEFDGDMSVQIPLQTSMENYDLQLQNNTNFMMGLIPYIVIRTNIEYSSTFINSNRVRDKIGKFKGFNTFDNFNLGSIICTDKEKELISDYLKEGIIL